MEELKTLEQRRAKAAWNFIKEVQGREFEGKYRSWAEKLPVLVMTNGLGPTLSFLKAKGRDELSALYGHLDSWIKEQEMLDSSVEGEDLIGKILNSDSSLYRQVTQEILAFSFWLKQFSEALLKKGRESER